MAYKLILLLLLTTAGFTCAAEMSVTVDDLPFVRIADDEEAREMTARLLQALAAEKVPVVGFVNEGKLEKDGKVDPARVALLKMWLDAGFELGNHTYSHIDLHHNTADDFEKEVIRGETITRELLQEKGMTLRYFRHPYLHTGTSLEVKKQVDAFVTGRGYTIAPVTIDNSEWIFALAYEKTEGEQKQKVVEAYLSYMSDKIKYWEDQARALTGRDIRHILLIHANRLNSEAMPQLLQVIRKKGYNFITLDEALKDDVYQLPDRFIQANGISWIHRWAITRGVEKDFFAGEPLTPRFILDAAGISEE